MRTGFSLGSNLGDRLGQLRAARDFLLGLHEGRWPPAVSPVYETEPVGCPPGSAAFFNAVVEIESSLDPDELLARLHSWEIGAGRTRGAGLNQPREIDIDLLYLGSIVRGESSPLLPHPRMTVRRFVLQPLADICPALVLPGQTETIAALLSRLSLVPRVQLLTTEW